MKNNDTLSEHIKRSFSGYSIYNLGACGAKPFDYLLFTNLVLSNSITAEKDIFLFFLNPKWFTKKYNNQDFNDNFFSQYNLEGFFTNDEKNKINQFLVDTGFKNLKLKIYKIDEIISFYISTYFPFIKDKDIFLHDFFGAKSVDSFFLNLIKKPFEKIKNYNKCVDCNKNTFNCKLEFGSGNFDNLNLKVLEKVKSNLDNKNIKSLYFINPVNQKLINDCKKDLDKIVNQLVNKTGAKNYFELMGNDFFIDENHLSSEGMMIFADKIVNYLTEGEKNIYIYYHGFKKERIINAGLKSELQKLLHIYGKDYNILEYDYFVENQPKKNDIEINVVFDNHSFVNRGFVFYYPTSKEEYISLENRGGLVYDFRNMLTKDYFDSDGYIRDIGKKIFANMVFRKVFHDTPLFHRFSNGVLINSDVYLLEKEDIKRMENNIANDKNKKIIIVGDSIMHMMDNFNFEYLSTKLNIELSKFFDQEVSVYNLSFAGMKHLDRFALLNYFEKYIKEDDIVVMNLNYSWLLDEKHYSDEMRNIYALKTLDDFSIYDFEDSVLSDIGDLIDKYKNYDDKKDLKKISSSNFNDNKNEEIKYNCFFAGFKNKKISLKSIDILQKLAEQANSLKSIVIFSGRNHDMIKNCMNDNYFYNNAVVDSIFDYGDIKYTNLNTSLNKKLFMDASHLNRDGTIYLTDFIISKITNKNEYNSNEYENNKTISVSENSFEFLDNEVYRVGKGYGKNSFFLGFRKKENSILIYLFAGNNNKSVFISDVELKFLENNNKNSQVNVFKKSINKEFFSNENLFLGEFEIINDFYLESSIINEQLVIHSFLFN